MFRLLSSVFPSKVVMMARGANHTTSFAAVSLLLLLISLYPHHIHTTQTLTMSDVEMSEETTPAASVTLKPEASRLFRVYKTISAMLDKRGYMIPKSMREMTPADFQEKFGEYPSRESLTILVVCSSFVCINVVVVLTENWARTHHHYSTR